MKTKKQKKQLTQNPPPLANSNSMELAAGVFLGAKTEKTRDEAAAAFLEAIGHPISTLVLKNSMQAKITVGAWIQMAVEDLMDRFNTYRSVQVYDSAAAVPEFVMDFTRGEWALIQQGAGASGCSVIQFIWEALKKRIEENGIDLPEPRFR